ncbi:hypothetical protein CMQ_7746 [Grosmannia clavigera kw1407]|uniref:Uncharacterized protein n=1 Tax=Grosmannia clavigera (strain kw1407 / UAMH 11150) TaxID=655863 RepID=F0XPJ8_GROCL|nr:uncharacterized protein CMQ_7746 [Grosmannia clavigera kw1407]EFX00744.1 hypothetical protein CMQ_7746 [Grosmannia clavigera kw1407]
MGGNLSKTFPDTSKDVISPTDAVNELILAVAWAGSAYAIGMIFTSIQIIDRWRGPRDDTPTNFFTVVAAFILSIPWPAVLVIQFFNDSPYA